MVSTKNVSFNIGSKTLLHESTIAFESGMFHVIMGANGAGKSTLLKLLAGEESPSRGEIFLNGKNLHGYSKKQMAVKRAVLSQHYNISFPIAAKEIVMMGRYPYFATQPSKKDESICEQVMRLMNVYDLAERDYNTLSGGEAQKVQMSRVLAQIWEAGEREEKILFLDEPVSHLDIKYQHQLLDAAKQLCSRHTTIIAVLHDINLAIAFADRILFMKQGKILYQANQLSEVSTEIIMDVFGVASTILYPDKHKPVVIF